MAKDFDQLKARATKKLTMIGEPFRNRDGKTDFEVLVYEEDGKIVLWLRPIEGKGKPLKDRWEKKEDETDEN